MCVVYLVQMYCVLVSVSLLLVSFLDQSLLQQHGAVLHSAKQLHSGGFESLHL